LTAQVAMGYYPTRSPSSFGPRRCEPYRDHIEPARPAPFISVCHQENGSRAGSAGLRRDDIKAASNDAAADTSEPIVPKFELSNRTSPAIAFAS